MYVCVFIIFLEFKRDHWPRQFIKHNNQEQQRRPNDTDIKDFKRTHGLTPMDRSEHKQIETSGERGFPSHGHSTQRARAHISL